MQEAEEYWRSVVEGIEKPSARRLIRLLDLERPLGLPASQVEASNARRTGPGKVPLLRYFLATKAKFPQHLLLVRVGEFYETVGLDAVLLVQHAGLNPMGDPESSGGVPRAGCPRANLRRTVRDLVEGAGLSVVVCEEEPEPYSYGAVRARHKTRYVAAVVTPAAPHLLLGLADGDADAALEAAPPVLGLSSTVGGITLIEAQPELRRVAVTEGLTEDAVLARLHEGGLAPPLFVHQQAAGGGAAGRSLRDAGVEAEWELRVREIFRQRLGAVVRYAGPDAVEGMLQVLRRQLALPADTVLTVTRARAGERPRPLYHSSAVNLGLHKARGVPPLLDSVVGAGAPLPSRRWLRRLLLLPPPPAVGLAVHRACRELTHTHAALPEFTVTAAANLVLKIEQRQASDCFFRELADLCWSVEQACIDPDLANLADALLVAAELETGHRVGRTDLATACRQAQELIHQVIDPKPGLGRELGGAVDPDDVPATEALSPATTGGLEVMASLIRKNEDFRGRVRAERLGHAHNTVVEAGRRVEAELSKVYSALLALSTEAGEPAKLRPVLRLDEHNNAIWIRMPRGCVGLLHLEALGLWHPKDRMGKTEPGAFSTPTIDEATDDYRRACSEAARAVRQELSDLAGRLQQLLPLLTTASVFSMIAAALESHVREAARRGWALPTLAYGPDAARQAVVPGEALEVTDMWPYWLQARGGDDSTVLNSFSLSGLYLLTGPNMAGKSTVLRATTAVALLGSCGLSVPARAARIPYLDAFMLRNFSADSPLEGRSSFAVEMTEMRYVLEDASPRSLVCVDELGKGTEVRAGAALAGALVEALDAVGCKGIFATHLHALLDLPLDLRRTRRMRMEVAPAEEGAAFAWRPTLRMLPGACTESLALDVARRQGLSQAVVDRASALYAMLEAQGRLGGGRGSEIGEGGDVDRNELTDSAESYASSSTDDGESGDASSQLAQDESRTLDAAGELLARTAGQVLARLTDKGEGASVEAPKIQDDAPCESAETGGQSELSPSAPATVCFVRAGQRPPPRTVGLSCIYVVRRIDGWFYVGSTDSLRERIAAHRRRSGQSRVKDPRAEFAYVALGGEAGASSSAKAIEAAVIRAMAAEGFPLLSTADSKRQHVPSFASEEAGALSDVASSSSEFPAVAECR